MARPQSINARPFPSGSVSKLSQLKRVCGEKGLGGRINTPDPMPDPTARSKPWSSNAQAPGTRETSPEPSRSFRPK